MTTPQPEWLEELAKLYWEHKEKGVSEEYDAIKALFLKVEVEAYKKGYIDGGVKGYAKQHQKSAIIEDAFIADSFVETRRDLLLSGLCSDIPPFVTLKKIQKALKNLTEFQKKVINQMQKPVLQLKPKRKKDAYIAALNSNKPMPDQIDAYVSPKMHEMWDDRDRKDGLTREGDDIIGWQVGFVEGADAPDLLPGDDKEKKLGERCKWFAEEYGSKGVQGADFRSDALLQIRGLRKTPPRPVDDVWGKDKTWTMLNGEPIKDSLVAGADWDGDRVAFFEDLTDSQDVNARFRASVMVRIEL